MTSRGGASLLQPATAGERPADGEGDAALSSSPSLPMRGVLIASGLGLLLWTPIVLLAVVLS